MSHNILYTGAVALAAGAAVLTGVFMADAAGNTAPAAGPTAVVTTTQEPGRLAPRCFETSVNGTQDCAWVPIAACLTDEDGDDAIPENFDGCYWDAESRGNHAGTSYVYWRMNRG